MTLRHCCEGKQIQFNSECKISKNWLKLFSEDIKMNMLKKYFYCLTILDTNIIYNSIASILSFTRKENIAITTCENYSRESTI